MANLPSTTDTVHEDGSPDRLAIDTIRTLSMDAVQKANSGHPGTPMALAPVAYTLWKDFIRYDPAAPDWPNRDRFVLSVGHASMLLYSVLHLASVEEIDADGNKTGEPAVSLADIEQFRQLGSKTPGQGSPCCNSEVHCREICKTKIFSRPKVRSWASRPGHRWNGWKCDRGSSDLPRRVHHRSAARVRFLVRL